MSAFVRSEDDLPKGVSSAGKTFNVTGWKIGWALASQPLLDGVLAAKQFLTFAGGSPFQPAVAHALRHEQEWVADLRASLRVKRDRLTSALAATGLAPFRSEGTYFVCADAEGVRRGRAVSRPSPGARRRGHPRHRLPRRS